MFLASANFMQCACNQEANGLAIPYQKSCVCNQWQVLATGNLADLEALAVGQEFKLKNESHSKGCACCMPFEISQVLLNNVYILVDQDGVGPLFHFSEWDVVYPTCHLSLQEKVRGKGWKGLSWIIKGYC
ncbi:hypothetical protein VP01_4216g2 [Puccinia sorghi]|uniref:Uncharacterized protein n=1 Tax=Puccinia sorghi TaxID=27349 RepID=A0A0L6URJ3_9BASI|nr:hypothetical protein VP01_4216g2 [Puccinia sorghi]